MEEIVGRIHEKELLNKALQSQKPELLAVYGRRRIGKTFLIREFYKKNMIFEITGLYKGSQYEQIDNFMKELRLRTNNPKLKKPRKWLDVFSLLESYLNQIKTKRKKVIFIDEFPWIATQKSKFLMAFENFWNSYATKRNDLVVVICGSAASYMINKIIHNKGGLHNRITQTIQLLPFDLYETQQYLQSKKIKYSNFDILHLYMAIGGVPHYLEKIENGKSVAQNLDCLCFKKDGVLKKEFEQLFTSLFDDSEKHLKIITVLSQINKGLSRTDIAKKTKINSGGDLTKKLNELIQSGFVSEYRFYNNVKKQILFRLSDEYSMFYMKFIKSNKNLGAGTWMKLSQSRSYSSWVGTSFETLCLKHIYQIKKELGIQTIYSTNSSWYNSMAQIDLLIDRDDNIINVCEMKFSHNPYKITKSYYENLKRKTNEFRVHSKTRKTLFVTLITTFGLEMNPYSLELVTNQLQMDSLFEPTVNP